MPEEAISTSAVVPPFPAWRVIAAFLFVYAVVWSLLAAFAYANHGFEPDSANPYNLSGPTYGLSYTMRHFGLDLRRPQALRFGLPTVGVEVSAPQFYLPYRPNDSVHMVVRTGRQGYPLDLSSDSVTWRLGSSNSIRMSLSRELGGEESAKVVAYGHRRSIGLVGFFLFRSRWTKAKIEYLKLEQLPQWREMQQLGVGPILQRNEDAIGSVVITLTPRRYKQYVVHT